MGINKRGWGTKQSEYIICIYEMVKEQNLIKKKIEWLWIWFCVDCLPTMDETPNSNSIAKKI